IAALVGASAWATPAWSNPTIAKGPYLQALGPDAVEVRVEVEPPAVATLTVLREGEAPRVVAADGPKPFHVFAIGGLLPRTRYEYEVALEKGEKDKGTFTTAPQPDSGAPFRFIIYGDNRPGEVRSDATKHEAVVRALLREPSDFLVHTGD